VSVFANLWDDARIRLADDAPDWLHRLSRRQPAATLPVVDAAYVVLQDDRPDGLELVTLRYRLAEQGRLRAYAGAGLNRTQYFVDGDAAGPSLLTRRNRHTGVGPTAELGAENAVSDQVRLNADVRWVDLDARADLLRGSYGPVAADPVTLGVSLGYRFR
jgi:OmpW family